MNFQNTFQQTQHVSNTSLSCYCYYGESGSEVASHCHSYYEIAYIYSGERNETINNKVFPVSGGSLLFIPPLAIHSLKNKTEVYDLVIQFSEELLHNACPLLPASLSLCTKKQGSYILELNGNPKLETIFGEIKTAAAERDAFFPILREQRSDATILERLIYDLKVNNLCTKLIEVLISEGHLTLAPGNTSQADAQSLNPVISSLLEHPECPPDMTEAAYMSGMSYSHFSRVFQKGTGYSYSNFCNQLRIRRAEELLIGTDMSITAVASEVGIDTLPYFTRLFHKTNGMTPSEYRKLYQ